jgi:hypothetical protein
MLQHHREGLILRTYPLQDHHAHRGHMKQGLMSILRLQERTLRKGGSFSLNMGLRCHLGSLELIHLYIKGPVVNLLIWGLETLNGLLVGIQIIVMHHSLSQVASLRTLRFDHQLGCKMLEARGSVR